MKRKTGIICTLGPASRHRETIARMARAGMDMARINFSHGSHRQHLKTIRNVREVNRRCGYNIKLLQDLEGYRIRIGRLKRPVRLKDGETLRVVLGRDPKENELSLDFNVDISAIRPGMSIFINDGMIELKALRSRGAHITARVVHGGRVTSKKGVNIPGLKLKGNSLTGKDENDLRFGMAQDVDLVALSFVRNKQDILRVRKMVAADLPDCRIIAKIENREGIRNIDGILDVSDGIIVARGDLGVSLPIFELPVIQKDLIRRCRKKKKVVMTATQMLESMTEYTRPTRAEVTDVANAILDGTHYVMLSGETAVGRYPVETVKMMRQIIEYTEKHARFIRS